MGMYGWEQSHRYEGSLHEDLFLSLCSLPNREWHFPEGSCLLVFQQCSSSSNDCTIGRINTMFSFFPHWCSICLHLHYELDFLFLFVYALKHCTISEALRDLRGLPTTSHLIGVPGVRFTFLGCIFSHVEHSLALSLPPPPTF